MLEFIYWCLKLRVIWICAELHKGFEFGCYGLGIIGGSAESLLETRGVRPRMALAAFRVQQYRGGV